MTHYLEKFDHVGSELDRAWREFDYNTDVFPALAAQAAERLEAPDLTEFLENHYDAYDPSHSFSSFDLFIYKNERIRIEVLHWLDHSTSIHQHGFCGAFKLLRGRSLNVESHFEITHRINHDFLAGHLRCHRATIMQTGSIHEIHPADAFIHANFHLGRPVVTMVIRTNSGPSRGPQFCYLAPHFAFDPFDRRASVMGRAAMVDVIAQVGKPGEFEAMMKRQLALSTVPEAVQLLMHRRVLRGDSGLLERLLAAAAERHPELAQKFAATAWEERRRDEAVRLRRKLEDIDQKFLLALLANLSEREIILSHLAQEFPGEAPSATAARLLHAMASAGHLPALAADAAPALAAALAGYPLSGTPGSYRDAIATLLRHPVLAPLAAKQNAERALALHA